MAFFFFTLSFLQALAHAECPDAPVDVLLLGDSQTGGSWATAYFGNFVQGCLKSHPDHPRFAIYGRGGTQPVDWIYRKSLDSVDLVFRDAEKEHEVTPGSRAPECKKRIPALLKTHRPKKIVLFFGDNLLSASTSEIRRQYRELLDQVKNAAPRPEECILITPTFEMEVTERRNVPAKNLLNTKKVINAIKSETQDHCVILDGLELMKNSAFLDNETLKRISVPGTRGCLGGAINDNIHLCGEAAKEFAEQSCKAIRNF